MEQKTIPFRPLGRGFLTGAIQKMSDLDPNCCPLLANRCRRGTLCARYDGARAPLGRRNVRCCAFPRFSKDLLINQGEQRICSFRPLGQKWATIGSKPSTEPTVVGLLREF